MILYNELRAAVREWTGDAEYERYLRYCARHNESPLDRGRFFARRLEQRYRRRSRCC
jgi:uncharacterized short protein YbdD (DUF466 family)